MRKIIEMNEIHIEQNKLSAQIRLDKGFEISARGQMLVDSDQFALVYIIEYQGEYAYLSFPEETWPVLHEGLKNQFPVYVNHEEKETELVDFMEELAYLVDNIKGNANYGDDMGQKIEKVFLSEA
ncbi:UPF0738 family protein [Bacillus testis]|uniref:UPF0738 family protein n=1 Tax=Bacillus testis TaxID=1622072 RepID=UPI00067EEFA1|nr:hypothetical protein [Bacillus testis]